MSEHKNKAAAESSEPAHQNPDAPSAPGSDVAAGAGPAANTVTETFRDPNTGKLLTEKKSDA
jgi:hypothetical protein